jgi:hypothetical protein
MLDEPADRGCAARRRRDDDARRRSHGLGYVFVAYALFGLGFGLVNPPITGSSSASSAACSRSER